MSFKICPIKGLIKISAKLMMILRAKVRSPDTIVEMLLGFGWLQSFGTLSWYQTDKGYYRSSISLD